MSKASKPKVKAKIGYVTKAEFLANLERDYGPEFFAYWRIQAGLAPKVCPRCERESIEMLYLGLPRDMIQGKIWCKWYLWCASCRHGIYCPPGSYQIKYDVPHVSWGDKKALAEKLPADLILIRPRLHSPTKAVSAK
jgi:hypothetical protein